MSSSDAAAASSISILSWEEDAPLTKTQTSALSSLDQLLSRSQAIPSSAEESTESKICTLTHEQLLEVYVYPKGVLDAKIQSHHQDYYSELK